jgi:hypothetical protein
MSQPEVEGHLARAVRGVGAGTDEMIDGGTSGAGSATPRFRSARTRRQTPPASVVTASR